MRSPHVEEVYSVSNHVSDNFDEYISLWRHNGWWFFNDPSSVKNAGLDTTGTIDGLTLFYYEAFERQYDKDTKKWSLIEPEVSLDTAVVIPEQKTFYGYDVVTYTVGTSPECSPLSCNGLASKIETNRFCLLDDLANAKQLLEAGAFDDGEPGPFRIIAVYTAD